MIRKLTLVSAACLLVAGTALATMQHQAESQVIPGSEAQVPSAGRATLAQAGAPGPAEALEFAAALDLTDAQRQQLRGLQMRLQGETAAYEREIIVIEKRLSRSLSEQSLDQLRIEGLTTRLGQLHGRLRAAQLQAQLETQSLLQADQLARYAGLRAG